MDECPKCKCVTEKAHALRFFGVILVSLIISLGPWTSDTVISITGLVLQLLGIGTVIWGIEKTKTDFGLPSMKDRIKAWIQRVLRRQNENNTASFNIVIPVPTGHFRLSSPFEILKDASLEERIKAVEEHMVLLDKVISNTQKEYDEKFRKAKASLENESQMRESEDNGIREKLMVSETGGLHISAIGALLLFFGVILGTIPQLIEDVLEKVWQ